MTPDIVIAVPMRNEARSVPRLLRSLGRAARRVEGRVTVLALANDCEDGTADALRRAAIPFLDVVIEELRLPPDLSSAGYARRLCMDHAAALAPEGVMLTTDADAVVTPGWIAAALTALDNGADLVCGTIAVCRHAIPPSVSNDRIVRAERAYADLLHEVRYRLDLRAGRQPPTGRPHYMESGAALALRTRTYHALGGLPHVSTSEDRALVHRAGEVGLRVTYCPQMRTFVSARMDGRAEDGMAACLRTRMTVADPPADQSMLSVATLADLWAASLSDPTRPFPDRSHPFGARLRASDLERMLPELQRFVTEVVHAGIDHAA
ncbi:glycosyltransferase [Falsirhodobacter halotolerans]|uniref:glycosyltransferase n=1 Tax=Falsirhodobacter halotolerans TaxID=1146892 RepID=UPI001FD455C9|nr:glycosyltransferase family 2 protein [Falsirhodobacter halotolerans]MCJ8139952.1 glycosyltransferase family 2 protein [Falsirhodobacter halotolerans]